MGLSFYYIPGSQNTPTRVTHLNTSHKATIWFMERGSIKRLLKNITESYILQKYYRNILSIEKWVILSTILKGVERPKITKLVPITEEH